MQWHYELVLGVGASLCLCYDAVDRLRCREDVYYLAGALRVEAYVSLVALELAAAIPRGALVPRPATHSLWE